MQTVSRTRSFLFFFVAGCFAALAIGEAKASDYELKYLRVVSSASVQPASANSGLVLRYGVVPNIAIRQTSSDDAEWTLRPLVGKIGAAGESDRIFFDRFETIGYLFDEYYQSRLYASR